ncbi:MAG: type III polyketide synthase [Cytophagaceae bacterium]|nr:MAG: type III polyketide synthase [Cytophagaceae bacterium]
MQQPTEAYINAIGRAVPETSASQEITAQFMADMLECDARDRRRLMTLYRFTRIEKRHSVIADYARQRGEFTFYPNTEGMEPFPTVSQRMQLYRREAVPLALNAIQDCFNSYPDFDKSQITHVITISCTGLYAPGPDIEIIEALGLPGHTQRLAINFMGCYGAFNGLKTASSIVRSNPDAAVLVVCIELCSIHFQKKTDTEHLLANALFADGSAAVIVQSKPRPDIALRLRSFYCDLLPEGKAEMAWHVDNFGFEMTLTSEVPTHIQRGIRQLMHRLLSQCGLDMNDIGLYALHPGGRRILEVIEEQLGLSTNDNRYAYAILREYGNMSSATVLFVLQRIWADLASGALDMPAHQANIFSCAFGPGLTLESMITEVVMPQLEPAEAISESASASPQFS